MSKLGNIFQAAYIGFAALFIYQAFINWGVPGGRSYVFIAGAIIALFKFFFNKKYRQRFETHYKKREEEKKNK